MATVGRRITSRLVVIDDEVRIGDNWKQPFVPGCGPINLGVSRAFNRHAFQGGGGHGSAGRGRREPALGGDRLVLPQLPVHPRRRGLVVHAAADLAFYGGRHALAPRPR